MVALVQARRPSDCLRVQHGRYWILGVHGDGGACRHPFVSASAHAVAGR